MSRGTPDTGDDNPFASGRIVRTMLIIFVLFMAFWAMGRLAGILPSLLDFWGWSARNQNRQEQDRPPSDPSEQKTAPEADKRGARIQQAFVGNRGLVTAAQAQEIVTTITRMQKTIEELPEEARAKARAERDKLASELFKARLKAYLAAPAATRRDELDRQIRQDELMRRAWKASRSHAATGEGFPGGGGGWPGEGGAGGSEDDRNRFLKSFLDSTSPEQRARYDEYRRAMEMRRQQLRLSP